MAGLRLTHPTERSVRVIVPHPGGTDLCPRGKEIHLNIDSDGFVIVSTTVWELLKECEGFGFTHKLTFANEVANPPTQGVGFLPPKPEDIPDVVRVGHVRNSDPTFIEKMKREGIIPKSVKAVITEYVNPKQDEDSQE